ncbi:MAG: T9SS type A sorting domain-containing protein [Candidatus Marinimicrobia bacterium]|nr:T9SS type A sorting domain-containing protein [Candidatus Neomarinimicrobiota bacterium]
MLHLRLGSNLYDFAHPEAFRLLKNYPNPFNPTTVIRYQLPVISEVQLTVYDLMGRVVRELVSSKKPAGTHNIIWNDTDAHGQPVASGMYLYQLKTDTFMKTKKLVLLK